VDGRRLLGNPVPGGLGAVRSWTYHERDSLRCEANTTNNRIELMSVSIGRPITRAADVDVVTTRRLPYVEQVHARFGLEHLQRHVRRTPPTRPSRTRICGRLLAGGIPVTTSLSTRVARPHLHGVELTSALTIWPWPSANPLRPRYDAGHLEHASAHALVRFDGNRAADY